MDINPVLLFAWLKKPDEKKIHLNKIILEAAGAV